MIFGELSHNLGVLPSNKDVCLLLKNDIAYFYTDFSSRLVLDLTIEQLIYGNPFWVCRNTKRSSQRYSLRSNKNTFHAANQ